MGNRSDKQVEDVNASQGAEKDVQSTQRPDSDTCDGHAEALAAIAKAQAALDEGRAFFERDKAELQKNIEQEWAKFQEQRDALEDEKRTFAETVRDAILKATSENGGEGSGLPADPDLIAMRKDSELIEVHPATVGAHIEAGWTLV